MRKTHIDVIGVHNSVRLVLFANQRFKADAYSVIEVHSGVTLVIPAISFEANFAL